MLRSDAEHGGANTNVGVERNDFSISENLAEPVDEVDFSTDGPFRACGGRLDGFDDALSRTDLVSGLGDLETAFGMDDDANTRMLVAYARYLLRREALVDGAIAFPQDDARIANGLGGIPAKLLVWVPENHLVERNAHAIAGVTAEMLVGKEQNFFATFEGPFHDGCGVGTGAD